MNVSVALCTYNGGRFIKDQIDSIAAQTRVPDEVIVCDDASTDDTAAILSTLAPTLPFPIRVHRNPTNLGSTRNFDQAIGLCTGEIIFLCDQDDQWREDKVERILREFTEKPETGLVFSDAELVTEALEPIREQLWRNTRFWEREQNEIRGGRAFSLELRQNYVTGATSAFRSSFLPLILPIPDDVVVIHDGWIATLIAAVAPIVLVPEPLVRYRQHATQQIGALQGGDVALHARVRPKAHYEKHLHQVQLLKLRLTEYSKDNPDLDLKEKLNELDSLARHLQARVDLPSNPFSRLPTVVGELVSNRYHRHSNGWYSAVRDLYGGGTP